MKIRYKFICIATSILSSLFLGGCGATKESIIDGLINNDPDSYTAEVSYNSAMELSSKGVSIEFGLKGTTKTDTVLDGDNFLIHSKRNDMVELPEILTSLATNMKDSDTSSSINLSVSSDTVSENGEKPLEKETYYDYKYGKMNVYDYDKERKEWINSEYTEDLYNISGITGYINRETKQEIKKRLLEPLKASSTFSGEKSLLGDKTVYILTFEDTGASYTDLVDYLSERMAEFAAANPDASIKIPTSEQINAYKDALKYIKFTGSLVVDAKSGDLINVQLDFSNSDLGSVAKLLTNAGPIENQPGSVSSDAFISDIEDTANVSPDKDDEGAKTSSDMLYDLVKDITLNLKSLNVEVTFYNIGNLQLSIPQDIVKNAVSDAVTFDIDTSGPAYSHGNGTGSVEIEIDPSLLEYAIEDRRHTATININEEAREAAEKSNKLYAEYEGSKIELACPDGYIPKNTYDPYMAAVIARNSEGGNVIFWNENTDLMYDYTYSITDNIESVDYPDLVCEESYSGYTTAVTKENGDIDYMPILILDFEYTDPESKEKNARISKRCLAVPWTTGGGNFMIAEISPELEPYTDNIIQDMFTNVVSKKLGWKEATVSGNLATAAVSENAVSENEAKQE